MAPRVQLMSHAHPTDRLTFANIDYRSGHACYNAAMKDAGRRGPIQTPWDNLPLASVEIGHSTWIGEDVLLRRDVKIGIGSLVAARSVVTRDVPPYTLVAGNPARPKGPYDGYRHPPDLVARLLASRWWAYRFTDFEGLDTSDPRRFLDGFERAVADGRIHPWTPDPIHLHDALPALC